MSSAVAPDYQMCSIIITKITWHIELRKGTLLYKPERQQNYDPSQAIVLQYKRRKKEREK